MILQRYEDGDTVSYKYDNSGALACVTDSATGRTTTYYYDFTDRLMKYVESGSGYSHSAQYEYDTINNLTKLVETINGVTTETAYTYDDDNRVTGITSGTTGRTYSYDGYGRVSQWVTKNGASTILTDTFTFRNPTASTTSAEIASMGIAAAEYNKTYSYTYDDNGNITSISDGTSTVSYEYDTANQLIRENNQAANKTTTWTYDNAGNIIQRNEYDYTTAENPGTPVDTVNYSYDDSAWGDLLTAYDGSTITYDEIGNPLSDGTWTYTWQHGRELASMTGNGATWNYTYDSNGMRTGRTNGTTTYSYVYNGGHLSQMTVGSDTLRFAYDASGTPMAVTYNGTPYYYVTNLQGDVIAILNSSGTTVVGYTYDAWGNPLTVTETLASTLGTLNPLRYRGYVYDTETGLYYLQSRYYNPEIGRFINADVFATTGQGLLGNNMFAYCLNNPIIHADYVGKDAVVVIDDDGLGHLGILVQDSEGEWWHFYWGTAGSGSSGSSGSIGLNRILCAFSVSLEPYTWCVKYTGEINLKAINNSKQYSGDYEKIYYFWGDFSNAIPEMKNPSGKYNLYKNNCSQKSLTILAKANSHYEELFTNAASYTKPKDAGKYLKKNLCAYLPHIV